MTLPGKYRGLAWLLLLVAVLPWAAWHFAVGDTVSAWLDCRRMQTQLSGLAPGPTLPAAFAPDEREAVLSGVLLDTVRRMAEVHRVRVAGYEPRVGPRQDGLTVHTAQVTLTGPYSALLQAAARIEAALPACRLRTMEWRSASDRRTRQTQLTLTLYIQQIVLNP